MEKGFDEVDTLTDGLVSYYNRRCDKRKESREYPGSCQAVEGIGTGEVFPTKNPDCF